MPVPKEAAEAARDRYLAILSGYPGMTRAEVTKLSDDYAIAVNFASGIPDDLPKDLDGVPVIARSQ